GESDFNTASSMAEATVLLAFIARLMSSRIIHQGEIRKHGEGQTTTAAASRSMADVRNARRRPYPARITCYRTQLRAIDGQYASLPILAQRGRHAVVRGFR